MTDEEAALARANLASYDARKAQEKRDAAMAVLQPLVGVIDGEPLTDILSVLESKRSDPQLPENLRQHIGYFLSVASNLRGAFESHLAA